MNEKTSDIDLLDSAYTSADRLLKHISHEKIIEDQNVIEAHKNVIIKACKKSFYFFCKVVLGMTLLTPQTHKRWCDEIQNNWPTIDYFGRLKPRGTFKTSIYGVGFILWMWAIISPKLRFFYVSASQALIDEVSGHLSYFIGADTESLYYFVFGIKRDMTAEKNTQEYFNIIGRDKASMGASLIMRTAGGSVNGVHPHAIVCDDPMDKEDRESEAIREYKKRWFKTLYPLLVPFQHETYGPIKKIILIATRWHMNDLVSDLLKNDRWNFEVESVYKPDGSLQYPEFFGQDRIDAVLKDCDEIFFSCQYRNNPLPESAIVFDLKRLFFKRMDQVDIKKGTNVCFFDPSMGKTGSDYPAVFWMNILNGIKFFFHAIDQKVNLTELLVMIAKLNKQFNARIMQYETNNTLGMETTLYMVHKEVGHNLSIEGIHETRNKNERIRLMQPELYRPESYFFREDYKQAYPEMMNQTVFFPAWGADDFPDLIEKAVSFCNLRLPADMSSSKGGKTLSGTGTFSGSLSSSKKNW